MYREIGTKIMSNILNPWTNISWNNTIADCDKGYPVKIGKQEFKFGSEEYVDYINKKDKERKEKGIRPTKLTFDNCLPEPYFGDKNSEVYLLNMNPGEPDPDFNCTNDEKNGKYVQYCKNMLVHNNIEPGLLFNNKDCDIIYDPEQYSRIINDILENNRIKDFQENKNNKDIFPLRPHVGDVWQMIAWKKLREYLKRDPRLFIIEFFPYHSTSGFAFPKNLPSNAYRNELIKQAIDKGKLIVIMRQASKWYKIKEDNLGEKLEKYPNKISLRCKGRIWLTPGNSVIPPHMSLADVLNKF